MNGRFLVVSGVLLSVWAPVALAQQNRPGGGGGRGGFSPEQFVARMLENDTNGDGRLSRDEVPGQFAERMFENGDTNKDGYLDKAELTVIATSRRGPGGEPPPPEAAGAGDERSFHQLMEGAGSALRRLRRAVFGETPTDQVLGYVQVIQSSLIAAKGKIGETEMAPQAKAEFGDDRAAYEKAFRLQLLRALRESITLEIAVLEGKTEAASESLTKLIEDQNAGHEQFQEEEERPGGPPGGRPGGNRPPSDR